MSMYLDAYAVPESEGGPGQQSLNEEVSQVVGHLGRLWGGFRKQTVSALESAKKVDFAQVVTTAQKELGELTSDLRQMTSGVPATASTTAEAPPRESADVSEENAPVDLSVTPTPSTPPTRAIDPPTSPTTQNFFSRLQASIPPNLVSTVQANIPASLRQSAALDLAQLRTTLTGEFQRVQGVTRAQAEELARKSEGLLHEAVQGGREFLKDAVRVLPPDAQHARTAVWDGSDVWMMDVSLGTGIGEGSTKGKGKEKEVDWSSPGEATRAVATRAQALLRKLKYDPEVIRVDPLEGDDAKIGEMFTSWVRKEAEKMEGGFDGAEWSGRIDSALASREDGDALRATLDTLVPTEMTKETFWTRFFFRVYQIEREEERRKALLQGTNEKEEIFTWEDEEDEASPAANKTPTASPQKSRPAKPQAAPTAKLAAAAIPAALAGATTAAAAAAATKGKTPAQPSGTDTGPASPRVSSDEGSYDVVSRAASDAAAKAEESSEEEEDSEESSEEEESSDEEEPPKAQAQAAQRKAQPPPAAAKKVQPPAGAKPQLKDDDDEEEEESDESDWE